jgi:hypothetical protein
MTNEQRAEIARQNGAKSKGPKTEAGKAASARNGIKTGEHTNKFAAFVPPNSAVLCNEERQAYFRLLSDLLQIYMPKNQEASEMVRQIAIARWQINRLQTEINNIWNFELLETAKGEATLVEELEDMEFAAKTAAKLFTGKSPIENMNRQIDRLEMRIARLRKGILEVHKHFPNQAKPLKTKEQPQKEAKSEPTVYVTEHDEEVIAAYRREFPNHKIVLLPPDDVAKGIEIKDDLPPAPRRAA